MTGSLYLKVTGDKRLQNGLIDLLSGGMWPIAFIILNTWGPRNKKEGNTFNAFLFDWSSFDPRSWKSSAVKALH